MSLRERIKKAVYDVDEARQILQHAQKDLGEVIMECQDMSIAEAMDLGIVKFNIAIPQRIKDIFRGKDPSRRERV